MKYTVAFLVCLGLVSGAVVFLPDPIPAKCQNHAAGTCIPGQCKVCSSSDDRCCCVTRDKCTCTDPTCAKMK